MALAGEVSPPRLARREGRSLNPLRCTGTVLPPNLLLVAKTVFLCLLLQGYITALAEPFLPLLAILEELPRPALVRRVMQTVMLVGGGLLLLNRAVRPACLAIGLAFLVSILAARGSYLNANFYCVALFLLIGLYEPTKGTAIVRAQIVIVYLGSALNKMFEPDWWSGQYFEHWMREIVGSTPYEYVASRLPEMWLSRLMGWGTIAFELVAGIGLAVRSLRIFVIPLALGFHTLSVLLAQSTFGIFYSALVLSFLVFGDWPEPGNVRIRHDLGRPWHRGLRRVAERLDFDGMFDWRPGPRLELQVGGRAYRGAAAVVAWAVFTPAFYFVLAVLLTRPGAVYWWLLG